jgi:hypothetical protein
VSKTSDFAIDSVLADTLANAKSYMVEENPAMVGAYNTVNGTLTSKNSSYQ